KVLSVLLAAAMVMGMSVSAFADTTFGAGSGANTTPIEASDDVTFKTVFIVRNNKVVAQKNADEAYDELQAEDQLYFPIYYKDSLATVKAPADWQIKINNAEYVDGATFFQSQATNSAVSAAIYNKDNSMVAGTPFVKVSLTDFSDFEDEDVNFYFYIYDKSTKTSSEKVKVSYEMENYKDTLKEEDLDWVITVAGPKAYKYDSNAKAKLATFDFNEAAFVEVKLFPGTTYKVNVNTKYDKTIAKEYPEADFDFVELSGDFDKTADVVIPSSKDNKYIYEVVDGELVPVNAEYVKDHKFESGEKVNGYLFEATELGKYAISDVELDLEVEETKNESNTNNSGNKTNPETGANDFVGAAVALAVVSVAAAGALAFKK
ncbi:MAG: hypothetical protein ACI4L5_06935, partial [Negativibacillus sp.]